MSGDRGALAAEALRRAFDERFAEPVAARVEARERLLLVDVGGLRAALRVSEIAGIHAVSKIVRVPGGAAALLGLTGVRGRVVPVFDLAAMLGASPPRARRWIVLAGAGDRVGLLIAEIEGWAEVAPAEIRAAAGDVGGRHVGEIAAAFGAHVPILSIPSVLREIGERTHAGGTPR